MKYKMSMRKPVSRLILGLSLTLMSLTACEPDPSTYREAAANPEFLHRAVKQLNDIIVYDIFSPPVASRNYAYPSVAAYEALRHDYPEYQTLAGQLHGLESIPQPEAEVNYSFPVASIAAFIKTSKAFVFSEVDMDDFEVEIMEEFASNGIPKSVIDRSKMYGEQVAEHIIAWADKDNYKQTRSFPKFEVREDALGRWKPTPPAYMEGIEPHWNQIRPFVIDSATQFVPPPPPAFDLKKQSTFYKDMMEVYDVVNNLTEEQKDIAAFWDCNPYVLNVTGHVMFATKKITPGGHWIGITRIACRSGNKNIMESAEAYVWTSIALADAFISCWDEKYRSSLIRPETVINEELDPDWVPLLQTPPFPEYTSGHSVISRAAALALTHVVGDDFSYIDSVEVEYGLKPRTYNSFLEASEEAGISRLYGGIHYMPAIEEGIEQGKKVGNYIINNLKTRKELRAEAE